MKPDTPILMISLQIPVQADTTTDQVLDAIGQKVSEALYEIRQKQAARTPEPIVESAPVFDPPLLKETVETYTDDTRPNLLAALGYASND